MTPITEPACSHCGAAHSSELPVKIIIIVGMFIAAFIISILLAMLR